MTTLFAVIALIVGFALLVAWFINADPRRIMGMLRWVGVGLALLVVLFVLLTGRVQLLVAALALIAPWLIRVLAARRSVRAARGPSAGQTSEVQTRFVRMQLNHDTGEMDGVVQEGPHAGRNLSDMPLDAVVDLLAQAAAEDEQSAQVIQAYLDRMHGDEWREQAAGAGAAGSGGRASSGSAGGPMSRDEARSILGVGGDATEAEIKQAHRRLMQQFHPDHGGTDYLAARINEAKEVLLSER